MLIKKVEDLLITIYCSIVFEVVFDCREMWWKRMNGSQKSVEDWSKLLRVHRIVLREIDDAKPWLKFASLCRQNGRMVPAIHFS